MRFSQTILRVVAPVALWMFVFTGFPEPAAAKVITDLKPTVSAKGIKRTLLKKVGVIDVDTEYKDFFLVAPTDLAAAPNGDIFVYDSGFPAIFRFDKNLQFICKFGRGGVGPGEIYPQGYSGLKLYIPKNNSLLFCDVKNSKIIHFDFSGKVIEEFPLNHQIRIFSFYPVMDEAGNFYSPSVSGGVADKWNRNGELTYTYLDESIHGEFLIYEPPLQITVKGRPLRLRWDKSGVINTWCNIFDGKRLLIYTANNASIHLFKDDQPVFSKPVWIDEQLPIYETQMKEVEKQNENIGKNGFGGTYGVMYNGIIRKDNDDNASFYIQGLSSAGEEKTTLYKFNLQGQLMEIFEIKEYADLYDKRNHRFYFYKAGRVKIFEIASGPGRSN